MSLLFKPPIAVFSLFLGLAFLDSTFSSRNSTEPVIDTPVRPAPAPKIQAAILLDVSSSMDGLIEQAKAQLWNMVSVMGKAKCETGLPTLEIALYEYGRTGNNEQKGYVKQISPFTSDLDFLSQELFKLKTNGGLEYCGQVIYSSLEELKWDSVSTNYKVIFIAGNEDFLQGNITYSRACEEARKKGVIVNTIYCGSREQGIREHWNLAGECGNGNFTVIDHNSKAVDIPTPYDSTLFVLNNNLNNTYIGYGSAGAANLSRQASADQANYSMNKSAMAKRVSVKGNKQLYSNEGWDLVDAMEKDKKAIEKLDVTTLSDSLKRKTKEEIVQLVEVKTKERAAIQAQITSVSAQREKYIATEKARTSTNTQTLETEVERIIKEQAKRYNMVIQ